MGTESDIMKTRPVILTILIVLAIILMIQNKASVSIQLLFWSVNMPRVLLIVIILLIGFASGYIVATMIAKKGAGS